MSKTPHGEEPPCPITGRPYFMHIEHPDLGDVPTYGGPFDSYTAPFIEEGDAERNLRVERYDHDAGDWIEGGEPTDLYIVTSLDYATIHDYSSLKAHNEAMEAERLRWIKHLLKARDEFGKGDHAAAYHELYAIASPNFDKLEPWAEFEAELAAAK